MHRSRDPASACNEVIAGEAVHFHDRGIAQKASECSCIAYSLSDDGNFKRLTQCAVGTFNFDGRYLFYTDADAAGSPVMRMSRSGSGAVKLCDVTDTMYITLLGDVVMLYCVSDGGSVSTVFVDRGSGDTYSPG